MTKKIIRPYNVYKTAFEIKMLDCKHGKNVLENVIFKMVTYK